MSPKKAEKIKSRLEKKRIAKLQKKAAKKEKKKTEAEKKKKSLSEIIDMTAMILKIVKIILKKFFGHLRIKVSRLHITVASPDAAMTAIAYGTITQTVSYLVALLENTKNVKGLCEKNICIKTDFLTDTPSADVKISFSLRVWHLFSIGIAALISFIKSMIKNKSKAAKIPAENK